MKSYIDKISEICRVSPAYNAENATVSQDVQPVWLYFTRTKINE